MGTGKRKKAQVVLILATVALVFGTGCGPGMKMKPIYNSAIVGGIVGAIVGHQVDRTGEGIAIGAGVAALGELLHQMDEHPAPPKTRLPQNQERLRPQQSNPAPADPNIQASGNTEEIYIVQIHHEDGSVKPVEIRKEGGKYISPTGRKYDMLPPEAELKLFDGL
jgi:hypothetical protein